MGFENLFFKKERPNTSDHSEEIDELSEEGKGRRRFLIGSGALAASALIPQAYGGEIPNASPEAAERTLEALRAYQQRLMQFRHELENTDIHRAEVWNILNGTTGIPATESSMLEAAGLSPETLFRKGGSWPAVQIRSEGVERKPRIRFAHSQNKEDEFLSGYGNGFFVDEALISNRHAIEESFRCEILEASRADIGGCAVADLPVNENGKRQINRVDLAWDRRNASRDLHGKLAHVPSIHETRGKDTPDNTDITSGVLFKITPGLLSEEDRESLFGVRASREFREALLASYACIVPPRDSNEDGTSSSEDLKGISGSPVFLEEDCASGNMVPLGIEWGAITLSDPVRKLSYTVMLVHGPDVLASMIDRVNTVVSMELDENEVPSKRALTAKVQMALHEYGYDSVSVDGLYGEELRQAVFDFQMSVFTSEELESVVIPGVVDRRTWAALFPEDPEPNKRQLWNAA